MTETYLLITFGAIVAALGFTLVCVKGPFAVFQQEGYCGRFFLKWYFRSANVQRKRFSLLTLALLLLTALFGLSFAFLGVVGSEIIQGVAFASVTVAFFLISKKAAKVPFRATHRAVRLAVCFFLICFGIVFGMCVGLYYAADALGGGIYTILRYLPVTLLPLVFPLIICLANTVMSVYEIPRSKSFIRRAKRALEKSPCVKVGITGSFGKTSVKHYAAALLGDRYRVLATPASYNTPIGIAKCVNEKGLDCDIFLAEMGARKVGDIKELCDMVVPKYAVVTGVCPQHLETFGSIENIRAEKGVLAQRAEISVLGATAADMKRAGSLVEGEDFAAEDVTLSPDGTSFTLRIGQERVPVKTALLGRHAAEDISLAAALCRLLGVPTEELAQRIGELKPVPHRLERIEGNGVHILDDSYNSNVEGAKDAVEVLKLFEGKKYVVTPGLVELGELEEEANSALGASLSGLDGVILVGETLVLSVRSGYLGAEGDAEKLRIVPTLEAAQNILAAELTEGDCVLFLNDLPDKYF